MSRSVVFRPEMPSSTKPLSRRMLTFSRARFEELLINAKKAFRKDEEGEIVIKMNDEDKDSGTWRQVAKKAKRSLKSVVIEAGVKERLERNILEFCQSRDWYLSRGVPWRLGSLLHGKHEKFFPYR